MHKHVLVELRTYHTCDVRELAQHFYNINNLFHNVVKWSDTLLKSCSICSKIFKVSDHFTTLRSKGLNSASDMETPNRSDILNEIF